ncbi:antibiotic biosynthesis monooxygenase [Sphingobacterium sp. CZ-UAM]|uniref:antibiotic biosynthesis monooxygenase n=1 Tax=unclassified Sphingobacterium TaxID=2609468 RepID=UPI0009D5405C|nr:antibiotic biosynthesis monooxygenase [Sphingobacterium sp. CZ-UAM]OOG16312.1 antibiotic biosynthesis monooxygenase [Sphingobacterium sp. CZ-UAM]
MENQGASVVITHHILDDKQLEYDQWLAEIVPLTKHAKGFIDLQVIRPIPNLTFVYTVIIRFDTVDNLKIWMESDTRKRMIEQASPLFRKQDRYQIKSGLEFLFETPEQVNKIPRRWKQYLVTWSAIYPLSLVMPMILLPVLRYFHISQNRMSDGLLISGCIVFLMVYLVMPNYTKLIRKWLNK